MAGSCLQTDAAAQMREWFATDSAAGEQHFEPGEILEEKPDFDSPQQRKWAFWSAGSAKSDSLI